jgi:hypothetical protein
MILKSTIAIFIVSMFFVSKTTAQIDVDQIGGQVNIISSAVPFLNFTPDSRSGAMGDAGVALSSDVNSQHWNPAKFAFVPSSAGVALSYTPWLRNLVPDMNMLYLTGFYRLDKMQVISTSLRYFSMGKITFTEDGTNGVDVNPYEMAFDLAYSRVLSDNFSGAVAFRFIRSDLYKFSGDASLQPGNAFAADIAFYYKTTADLFGQNSQISSGLNISNIGSKLSYDGGDTRQFIPTNMRLGFAVSTDLDAYNSFTFTVDLNKLLIPTPAKSSESSIEEQARKYQDVSTIKAMFQSFSDAPNGAKEEFQEITYNVGAEYWYDKQFAVRAGYFHEHENKGNRKYITAGLGIKFNMLTLDASYLVPVVQNNPLANTIRFTLGFDLDGIMK